MPIIAGLIVRRIKEKIFAETGQFDIAVGDKVIIDSDHCQEVGLIVEREKMVEKIKDPIAKIVRKLSPQDTARLEENVQKAHQAFKSVHEKIEDHELQMKLTTVEYSFDRSKLFVYYTAENRVDFRELIKDLGHILKTRIQMVQIGVRDEAKMIGGIGTCGRRLCCQEFLKDFSSVTIDMAKEQDLALNTSKLSGLCGRLMCCIAYEFSTYKQCKKMFPPIGSKVTTPDGPGTVVSILLLRSQIQVELQDKVRKVYELDKVSVLGQKPPQEKEKA